MDWGGQEHEVLEWSEFGPVEWVLVSVFTGTLHMQRPATTSTPTTIAEAAACALASRCAGTPAQLVVNNKAAFHLAQLNQNSPGVS